ncbi:hypothetical protein [Desulfosporosinus sp. FKA]|uniref:hypothetical protein n=1 Tax=Desulfosporosinus sp. FKA TaxID=1969834 RepID=UPI001556C631|nr:hypothetical protein [Desulfosporosinus sp. FKA]
MGRGVPGISNHAIISIGLMTIFILHDQGKQSPKDRKNPLDSLVTAGTITADQETAIETALQSAAPSGAPDGGHMHGGPAGGPMNNSSNQTSN